MAARSCCASATVTRFVDSGARSLACGEADGEEDAAGNGRSVRRGDAAAKKNRRASRPEAAAGGEKLFKRNCVECHGEDGSGLVKKHAADLQLAKVQEQSDGVLFWKITNGNPDRGMPSFSRLPELQRWQLVLYLRVLKPAGK